MRPAACVAILFAAFVLAGVAAECPVEAILTAQTGTISGDLMYAGDGVPAPAACVWRIKPSVDSLQKQLYVQFTKFALYGSYTLTLEVNGTSAVSTTTFNAPAAFPHSIYSTTGNTNLAKEITVRLSYTGGMAAASQMSSFELKWGTSVKTCPATNQLIPQMPVPQLNTYCAQFQNNSCCTQTEANQQPANPTLLTRASTSTACSFHQSVINCARCSPDSAKFYRVNETTPSSSLATYRVLKVCKSYCDTIWKTCGNATDLTADGRPFSELYTGSTQFCTAAFKTLAPTVEHIEIAETDCFEPAKLTVSSASRPLAASAALVMTVALVWSVFLMF